MKDIRLPLKKQWFDLTKAGIKTEDYREITPYWFSRLFQDGHTSKLIRQEACENLRNPNSATKWNFDNRYYFRFKEFENNIMTLGYPKSSDTERTLKLKHKGIEIREGKPEWGAEKGVKYFVIKHGGIR